MAKKLGRWVVVIIIRFGGRDLAARRRRTAEFLKALAKIIEGGFGDSYLRPAARAVALGFVCKADFQFIDRVTIRRPSFAHRGKKETCPTALKVCSLVSAERERSSIRGHNHPATPAPVQF